MNQSKTALKNAIKLSEKETQIINLIAYEYSEKDIGKELYMSYNTVHSYKKKIFQKFDVTNNAGAIRKAFELGLFPIAV